MPNITKRELVVKISNESNLIQQKVLFVVQRTLDLISDALAKGDHVELRNFGVFEVKITKPRIGRNPKVPGSRYRIPERATVKFKPGKIMRQKVAKLVGASKSL